METIVFGQLMANIPEKQLFMCGSKRQLPLSNSQLWFQDLKIKAQKTSVGLYKIHILFKVIIFLVLQMPIAFEDFILFFKKNIL